MTKCHVFTSSSEQVNICHVSKSREQRSWPDVTCYMSTFWVTRWSQWEGSVSWKALHDLSDLWPLHRNTRTLAAWTWHCRKQIIEIVSDCQIFTTYSSETASGRIGQLSLLSQLSQLSLLSQRPELGQEMLFAPWRRNDWRMQQDSASAKNVHMSVAKCCPRFAFR